eukprot:751014-Hanusia_phi.AAC.3
MERGRRKGILVEWQKGVGFSFLSSTFFLPIFHAASANASHFRIDWLEVRVMFHPRQQGWRSKAPGVQGRESRYDEFAGNIDGGRHVVRSVSDVLPAAGFLPPLVEAPR